MTTTMNQEQQRCDDCGRLKARSADNCIYGYCPKWYAINDKDSAQDCADIVAHVKGRQLVQAEPVAYPDERHIHEWFQLSTCAHHIDEDGEYIGKRAMFLACKAIDWYRAQHPAPKPAPSEAVQTEPTIDESAFIAIITMVWNRSLMINEAVSRLKDFVYPAPKPADEQPVADDRERLTPMICAFWRRIYPYRNDYGKELPIPLPVTFVSSMATAMYALPPRPPAPDEQPVSDGYTLPIAREGEQQFACVLRNRSGVSAGDIDMAARFINELSDGDQQRAVESAYSIYLKWCAETGKKSARQAERRPAAPDVLGIVQQLRAREVFEAWYSKDISATADFTIGRGYEDLDVCLAYQSWEGALDELTARLRAALGNTENSR